MRFARPLSLMLVFCLASTFTLACAFACVEPAAPALSSHCHQPEKTNHIPASGPALSAPADSCPMLTEMSERPVSLSASSAQPTPIQEPAILDLAFTSLANPQVSEPLAPSPPSPSSLPLYLRMRVLRI